MRLFLSVCLTVVASTLALADDAPKKKQFYELRQYQLTSDAQDAELDTYLTNALIPALRRHGAGPIGVFREIKPSDHPVRFVLIPYDSADQVAAAVPALKKDDQYQKDAAEYLSKKNAAFKRIRSELLHAFDCMPQLKVPSQTKDDQDRVFELRIYESATEQLGDLKVEMFNAGEVPIFLDCGIVPVFLGQAVVGDLLPSLTYMTVYDSMEAKAEAWSKFPKHPDWKTLSKLPKYKGTVSNIHKWELVPVKGSQL
ncbi:NIPSNAP family protein [Planctomycetota bacterium]